MLPLWPFVVSPLGAFTTPRGTHIPQVDGVKGWETGIKVQHCHVNGWTTAILQSERAASHMPLREDFSGFQSPCVWDFGRERKRRTYTKSVTNPFPTSIGLSASQYHRFTTPHPHVQSWLVSKQTCVCDVYCSPAWGFAIERTVSSWKSAVEPAIRAQCWLRTDLLVTIEKGPREKTSQVVVKIAQRARFLLGIDCVLLILCVTDCSLEVRNASCEAGLWTKPKKLSTGTQGILWWKQ